MILAKWRQWQTRKGSRLRSRLILLTAPHGTFEAAFSFEVLFVDRPKPDQHVFPTTIVPTAGTVMVFANAEMVIAMRSALP